MPTLFIFILPWKEEVCLYTGGVHNAAKCEGYKALLLWNGRTSFLSWLCLITHILFSKTRCIRKENQTWIYSKRIQDCSFHVLYHYEQNHGKLFLVTKYKNGKILLKFYITTSELKLYLLSQMSQQDNLNCCENLKVILRLF